MLLRPCDVLSFRVCLKFGNREFRSLFYVGTFLGVIEGIILSHIFFLRRRCFRFLVRVWGRPKSGAIGKMLPRLDGLLTFRFLLVLFFLEFLVIVFRSLGVSFLILLFWGGCLWDTVFFFLFF